MHAMTVAVDLATSVFQIAIADDDWKVVAQQRLTRSQFERWSHNQAVRLSIWKPAGPPTTGGAGLTAWAST